MRDQGGDISEALFHAPKRDGLLRRGSWIVLASYPQGRQARGWQYGKESEGAHIWGHGYISSERIPRGWNRPMREQVAGEVLARPPHWTLQSDSACLDTMNAVLDRRWWYRVGNHAVIVWRLAAGIGGGGSYKMDKHLKLRLQRSFSPALGELGPESLSLSLLISRFHRAITCGHSVWKSRKDDIKKNISFTWPSHAARNASTGDRPHLYIMTYQIGVLSRCRASSTSLTLPPSTIMSHDTSYKAIPERYLPRTRLEAASTLKQP